MKGKSDTFSNSKLQIENTQLLRQVEEMQQTGDLQKAHCDELEAENKGLFQQLQGLKQTKLELSHEAKQAMNKYEQSQSEVALITKQASLYYDENVHLTEQINGLRDKL